MPRKELTEAIRKAAQARGLSEEVSERIVAYLRQAEDTEFPNRDRAEQLTIILNALPALAFDPESDPSQLG